MLAPFFPAPTEQVDPKDSKKAEQLEQAKVRQKQFTDQLAAIARARALQLDAHRECRLANDVDAKPLAITLLSLGYFEIDPFAFSSIGSAAGTDDKERLRTYEEAQNIAKQEGHGVWGLRSNEAKLTERALREDERALRADERAERGQQQTRVAMYVSAAVSAGTSIVAILGSALLAVANDRRKRRDQRRELADSSNAMLSALGGELAAVRRQAQAWLNQADSLAWQATAGAPDEMVQILDWPVLSTPIFDANTASIKSIPKRFVDGIVRICGDAARVAWQTKTINHVRRLDIARITLEYVADLEDIVVQIDVLLPTIEQHLAGNEQAA